MRQSKLFIAVIILVLLGATVIGCAGPTPTPTKAVSESLVAQVDLSSWIQESFMVSSDSKRVAYVAQVGNKWFVVVDGDEGKQYDSVVTIGGGGIVFDSPDRLHYLAMKGNSIYLVEERIR